MVDIITVQNKELALVIPTKSMVTVIVNLKEVVTYPVNGYKMISERKTIVIQRKTVISAE